MVNAKKAKEDIMIMYCKDFDEDKCVYKTGGCHCGVAFFNLRDSILPSLIDMPASICKKKYSERKYITKFEYLMLKKLKEKEK